MTETIKPSTTVYFASFGALLGALSMGLSLGFTAPAFYDMETRDKSDGSAAKSPIYNIDKNIVEYTKSNIGSMLAIGALLGGLVCEPSNKFLGRRLTLICFGIPFIAGWVMIAAAGNTSDIIIGRFLTGLCSGLVSGTAPTYVIEIAPSQIRGLLGTCFQLMLTIGILLEAIFGTFMSWRILASLSLIPALGMSVIMIFMPETPQWLLSKSRTEEAEAALKSLRATNSTQELSAMTQNATRVQSAGSEYSWALLTSREFYKPFMLSLALMFFQQFSGINAVLFYQSDIFTTAAPNLDTSQATIYVCLAQVLASAASSFLVDRLGRRVLLLISGTGHTISLMIISFHFHRSDMNKEYQMNNAWVALVSLIGFIISFSLGYGPVPWMMVPELCSSRVRSVVASIASTFNWTCAFVVTFFVKRLIDSVGNDVTYWIFAIICAISLPFVLLLLPETKGKTQDQIQLELLGTESSETKPLVAQTPLSSGIVSAPKVAPTI